MAEQKSETASKSNPEPKKEQESKLWAKVEKLRDCLNGKDLEQFKKIFGISSDIPDEMVEAGLHTLGLREYLKRLDKSTFNEAEFNDFLLLSKLHLGDVVEVYKEDERSTAVATRIEYRKFKLNMKMDELKTLFTSPDAKRLGVVVVPFTEFDNAKAKAEILFQLGVQYERALNDKELIENLKEKNEFSPNDYDRIVKTIESLKSCKTINASVDMMQREEDFYKRLAKKLKQEHQALIAVAQLSGDSTM